MKQYLQIMEFRDERNRTMGYEYYIVQDRKHEGHVISHGYSYIKAREIIRDLEGEPIGLEHNIQEGGKE